MRFIRELINPELKCARTGKHKEASESRYFYEKAGFGDYRTVAYDVHEKRAFCRRCGEDLAPWEEIDREPLQGLSMPKSMWREMEKSGKVMQ